MQQSVAALVVCILLGGASPADEPPGTRVPLRVGQLFVPREFAAPDRRVHLVIHLHGSPQAAERNLVQSGWNAALVTVSLKGLSRAYGELFGKPETFRNILADVEQQLHQRSIVRDPVLRRVTVTSFSAGFGGVRELLRVPEFYDRIDALVMADSIYAGYRDAAKREVDPELMAGFLRFARDAAEGRKSFVLSHCEQQPDGYASTGETADYLLKQLALERTAVHERWADQLTCVSRSRRVGFQVFGFSGGTGADHMRHLHNLGLLMRRAGDESAATSRDT